MAATIETIEVNGIKVPLIFEHDTRLPLVTMQFTFTNSGSIADGEKAGLAKFSAKVMNEGTKKLGSTAFAEVLEAKAIHIASSTGTETFVMEVGSLSENFDEALERFDTLLQNPNFSSGAVEKVKTMTLGALSRKENDFDYTASAELKAMLFEGTPLANPSSGTSKSIESIELNDVKSFINSHLNSSNLIVVLGGDIDLSSAKKKIKELIKQLPKGTVSKVKNYDVGKKLNRAYSNVRLNRLMFTSVHHIK